MKFRYILLIILFSQLTLVQGKDKPFSYFNLGFGALQLESKWIKSYSIGISHDFNSTKRSSLTFGVFTDIYRLSTEYDADTTFTPMNIPNVDDSKRYYNYNFKATSLHFSINYKYWLNSSEKYKYYIEGGIVTNLIIHQNSKYEYYYKGWPNQTLYLGPFYVNDSYKPNIQDRIRNLYRPGIGFGFLEKISSKNYLTFQLYISHSMKFQTIRKLAVIYPRLSVGLTF